jgi:hypothetical protein
MVQYMWCTQLFKRCTHHYIHRKTRNHVAHTTLHEALQYICSAQNNKAKVLVVSFIRHSVRTSRGLALPSISCFSSGIEFAPNAASRHHPNLSAQVRYVVTRFPRSFVIGAGTRTHHSSLSLFFSLPNLKRDSFQETLSLEFS